MAVIVNADVRRAKKFNKKDGKKQFAGYHGAIKVAIPAEEGTPFSGVWKNGNNGEKFAYFQIPKLDQEVLEVINKGTGNVQATLGESGRLLELLIFSGPEDGSPYVTLENPSLFTFSNPQKAQEKKS